MALFAATFIGAAAFGGAIDGLPNPLVDTTTPQILAIGPPNGASNTPVGEIVYVVFSEEMNPATIDTSTIKVAGVSGTVGLSDSRVAYFVPSGALAFSTTYNVTVKSTVADLSGNLLGSDRTWSFSTTTDVSTVPTLYRFTANAGALIPQAGQSMYYQFEVAGGEELFVFLYALNFQDNFDFYIKRGGLPSAADHDYAGTENAAVQVKNAPAGTYFVRVVLSYDSNLLGCCPGGPYNIYLRPYWPNWTLGKTYTYTLNQEQAVMYRQFQACSGRTLAMVLAPENSNDKYSFYVKYDSLPTDLDYDYKGTGDTPILTTLSRTTTYHVMIRLDHDDNYLGCCPGGSFTINTSASPFCCCFGITGNVDGDFNDITDISDLSAMVDYLFFEGSISNCYGENDVDQSGTIDISDLQMLVDYLFFAGTLPNCP
jgi:hypothetical protein